LSVSLTAEGAEFLLEEGAPMVCEVAGQVAALRMGEALRLAVPRQTGKMS